MQRTGSISFQRQEEGVSEQTDTPVPPLWHSGLRELVYSFCLDKVGILLSASGIPYVVDKKSPV